MTSQLYNLTFQKLQSVIRMAHIGGSVPEGRSKERYRRIGLTTFTSALAKGVTVLTALISVPLTVGYLGVERYGLWMTITSVIAIMAFADLGIGNGLTNAIIKANAADDREAAASHISSGFFMLSATAVFVIISFAISYSFIPWPAVFKVKSVLAGREAGPAIAIFITCFAISMPFGTVQRVQIGYQEGFISNLWQCAGSVLGLVGILIAIYFKAGLPWLVLAVAGAPVIVTAINWATEFLWLRPWLAPKWKQFHWEASCKLMATGAIFFVLQMFTLLGNATDNLVLAHILGPNSVAQYSVAQKMFSVALLAQFFIAPLWPAFGEALERSDHVWVRLALKRAIMLSFGITAVIALPLLAFGKSIVSIWAGAGLTPSSGLLLALSAWTLLASYGGIMSALLNNGSLLRKQLVFFAVASSMALILKFVLTLKIGVSGVAWATIIGYGLFYCIPAALLVHNTLKNDLS